MDLNSKYAKVIGISEDGVKNLKYIMSHKNNKKILATEEISANQNIDKDYAAKILDETEIMFITYNSKEQRTCDIVKAITYMATERKIIAIGLDVNNEAKKVDFDLNAEFIMNDENKEVICELINMMVESVSEECTINIDLTDLKEALSTEQALAYGFVQTDNSMTKEQLVDTIFENILTTAGELSNKKALVFVSIGNDYCNIEDVLGMLTGMLENMQQRISEKCDLIFTLSLDDKLKDNIKLGLLHN